jgi:integrase
MTKNVDCSPGGIRTLAEEALSLGRKLHYGPPWLNEQRRIWRQFVRFVEDSDDEGSPITDLVRSFLNARGIEEDVASTRLRAGQRQTRSAMRSLTDYALHGCLQRRRCLVAKVQLTAELDAVVMGFVRHLQDTVRLSESSIAARRELATKFLHYLDAHGTVSVTQIKAQHLSGFVASRSYLRPNSLATELSMLRAFLRYLCMLGLVAKDLGDQAPRIYVRRYARIPSVWSQEQVDAILVAVDRTSPKGKRDYAILLLAGRLGMRASDIRALRLENLRWDDAWIEFQQVKTGMPHRLPLTEEIGEALIDYLRHGRPEADHREVFLTATAPIKPFEKNHSFYNIITDWRLRAGVELTPPSRQGLHSLRHTVATRLLEAGTPLDTISSVMGHISPETTRVYTKVDIDALRSVALDPEEVAHA